MDFRIADTFTDSLSRLTGDEQKAVKTTAFDLQMDPSSPGMKFHRLDKAKDRNFWSVRVNDDIRLIVHRNASSLLLCYVGHHDQAYGWAERRRLETHPKTGAAQLVEIRETVKEVVIPQYVHEVPVPTAAVEAQPVFGGVTDEDLLGYGVPPEWLADVRGATEESFLALADHLPAEAAEALLELAVGGTPRVAVVAEPEQDPFEHPDAQRRFRIMTNREELEQALAYPWEKWTIFLHPEQRQWVEKDQSGPARVSGSAGTGKTIVALHRAAHLARTQPDSRVLLTTFSDTLAGALRTKLKRLLHHEPRLGERIDVYAMDAIGMRLHKAHVGPPHIAERAELRDAITAAAATVADHRFSLQFLLAEWDQVVDAWQLESWEAYRDVARLGRRTRLPEARRAVLWSIYEKVHADLRKKGWITRSGMFHALARALEESGKVVFDNVVVDEAQDLSVAHLRFLAALGGRRPNALFFSGDLGQRIFQQPFSWKSLGVDVRGRSRVLRVNYRTSHQIRSQADRLLGPSLTDVDGNTEDRSDTISVFNGPPPVIRTMKTKAEESQIVAEWLNGRINEGLLPHEIGLFVRSDAELDRARTAAAAAGQEVRILDDEMETTAGAVSLSTMHRAKGLEFRAVAVLAVDDEIVPLQFRLESVGDDADLQEVYDTERQLLYVACTRARDHLLVTCVEPGSEFLDDMKVS